jgi:PKD repeat protein
MKIITKTLAFAIIIALTSYPLFAQVKTPCSTHDANKRMESLFPDEVRKAEEQLEEETIEFSQNRSANAVIYTIPVVFHILHTYGSENISDAQILDAVNILNRDFNKQNADTANIVSAFTGIAANVGVEFKLAKLDPQGLCTNGIDRIYTPLSNIADDDAKLNVWPRNKYLNIWVARGIASGAAGYSMYPSSVANAFGAAVDGIMILHNYVGSIGTGSASRSRALTHEVGHWINLPHPWGNSNTPGVASNCNIDDGVSDTPNTVGWTSCNLNGASCGSPIDNVQNFMEYSYCSNMFTNGQKTRMLAALTSNTASRSNLWSNTNINATGVNTNTVCVPVADFYAESPQVCVNSNIEFFDNTTLSAATTWSWSFPGGTPATSTIQSPVVQYNTPGTYSVTLNVSNATGNDVVTKNSYIVVLPTTADITTPNFSESFESLTINAASNWSINNLEGGNTWFITGTAGYTGTKSMKLNNITTSTIGSTDEFITPSIDLTQFVNPRLYYRVAYASITGTDNQPNSLQILSSVDCGKTWGARRTYTESTLATVAAQNAAFTPTNQNQWRQDNINLSLFSSYSNIQFKFKFESGEGNNIYIDDINIAQPTALTALESIKNNFRIFPNPTENDAFVYFTTESNTSVNIKVIDVLGKEVYTKNMGELNAGNHNLILNKDILNASGVYFVQLMVNDLMLTQKFILK